jgi:hypothetical protein
MRVILVKNNWIDMGQHLVSSYKIIVLATSFCTLIGGVGSANSQTILTIEEIKQLIPQIEAMEKKVLNVKIEAETWMEESKSPTGPWERAPMYVSATSWFDGTPKGKGRVDIHREVLNSYWKDKDRYIQTERSYTAGYDGQVVRKVYDKESIDAEKTRLVKQGEIIDQAPEIFKGKMTGVVTGLRFTTKYYFIDKDDKESFSQYFKIAISPEAIANNSFEVVREEHNGVQSIRLGLKHKSLRINYWFDPSRCFAFLGHENVRKNEKGDEFVDVRIKVNKLKEVTNGIWWPIDGVIESDRHDPRKPNIYARTIFHAIDVVVNDPKFDNSIFSVSFPVGYMVTNKIDNKTYKVTEDPNEQK